MIKFSARGVPFECSKEIILKKWKECLLKSLVITNIQLDEYQGSILIDINPLYLNYILDYLEYGVVSGKADYLCKRELVYIGINDEYIDLWKLMPLYENLQENEYNVESDKAFEYIFIYTRENQIIVLNKNIINEWKNCKFKEILYGYHKEYLLEYVENCIKIRINLDYKTCNILISMMRDNINCYYDILCDNEYLRKITFYYDIYNVQLNNILKKRYIRIKNKSRDIIFNDNNIIFFFKRRKKKK